MGSVGEFIETRYEHANADIERCHSREDQPPLRLRDLPAEFLGGFDPLPDDHLHVVQSLLVSAAVGGTARQFRDFGDVTIQPGWPT